MVDETNWASEDAAFPVAAAAPAVAAAPAALPQCRLMTNEDKTQTAGLWGGGGGF